MNSLPRSLRMPWVWIILIVLAVALWFAFKQPSQDRDWKPEFARLPGVIRTDGGFAVENVRDWQWDKDGATGHDYKPETYRIADLQRIWWVLEPDPKVPAVAHTFLLMEFKNDRLLGLSVEARARKSQTWGPMAGMFRSYELIYLWGSAKDLLGMRAVTRDHEMYMFPLALTREQMHTYLDGLLSRAQTLDRRPRWYNTALSNCTNELAKAAKLGWRPSFVLTGNADKGLHQAGLIDGKDLGALKSQAKIRDLVQRLNNEPDKQFDADLLKGLHERGF